MSSVCLSHTGHRHYFHLYPCQWKNLKTNTLGKLSDHCSAPLYRAQQSRAIPATTTAGRRVTDLRKISVLVPGRKFRALMIKKNVGHTEWHIGASMTLPSQILDVEARPHMGWGVWRGMAPFVDCIQLDLEGGLVLFHHILQGYGGVLRVLALGALPTHGRLTGLAVKFHHLWVTQRVYPAGSISTFFHFILSH